LTLKGITADKLDKVDRIHHMDPIKEKGAGYYITVGSAVENSTNKGNRSGALDLHTALPRDWNEH
jgi:hypothetical protein